MTGQVALSPEWEQKFIAQYSESTRMQVRQLVAQQQLAEYLLKKYQKSHDIQSDKALYAFVMALKNKHLRSSTPLTKVMFDSKIQVMKHALGLHTKVSRVQGGKLKAKQDIKIASLFKTAPIEFLTMIVVHELSHFKESDHNKAFFQLCTSMEPHYHQYEFDLRVYLIHLALFKTPLW